MHPLLALLLAAGERRPPPDDGRVEVLPLLRGGLGASVAFTAHAVVLTDRPAAEVGARADAYGGAHHPDVLRWLAGRDGDIGVLDLVLVGRGRPGSRLPGRDDLEDHPRVRHARTWRSDVSVFGDERGLVTLATGLAGRCELSIQARLPGDGSGGDLLRDGLALVPEGEPVFASVSPGNVRSLRLFLGCGFVPVASEVLLRPSRGAAGRPHRP